MGESRQAGALAITCVFPVLATLFIGARSLSRYLGRNFGWDDWLIYLSLLLLLGQTVTIYKYILVSHTGFRKSELPKQSVEEQVLALKWSFAVQMFYHPMMGAIRASIIMFLFRVNDVRRHIQWALYIVFWTNIGYLVSTSIVNIFQCTPIQYAFLRPKMDHIDADGKIIPGGTCINSLPFIISSCALSIFMDLIIIPIPTAMVWRLQMQRKTKLAVVAVMSMGWIATLASIIRLIVYYDRYAPTTDRTYNIGVTTSIIEPSIAIIAACAPALRRLFTFMLPHYFSDYAATYASRDGDGTTPTPTNNATYARSRPKRSASLPALGPWEEDLEADAEAELKEDEHGRIREVRRERCEGRPRQSGSVSMTMSRQDTARESEHGQGGEEREWCQRTQSVTTGQSEVSGRAQMEPFDVLEGRRSGGWGRGRG